METAEPTQGQTSEEVASGIPDSADQDAKNSTIEQQQGQAPKPLVLRRRGAPRRNKNGFKHGGRALQFARNRGLPIDGRTTAGKVEQDVYGDLLMAWGKVIEESSDKLVLDIESIDPVTLLKLQMTATTAARCYQHKQSRTAGIRAMKETMRKKGQKVPRLLPSKKLSVLDGYELPAYKELRESLKALGSPPGKEPVNLNDILQKLSNETDAETANEPGEQENRE